MFESSRIQTKLILPPLDTIAEWISERVILCNQAEAAELARLVDDPSNERGKLTSLQDRAIIFRSYSCHYIFILQQVSETKAPYSSCLVRNNISFGRSHNTTSSAYASHETRRQIGAIQKTTNHHVLPPASLCTRKRLVASNLESRSVRLSIGFHPWKEGVLIVL